MSDASVRAKIAQLQQMSVGELREEWRELYGEETRSRHKVWLFKRLAWRVQELEYGGLSERAKKRLEELMPNAELALRLPKSFMDGVEPAPSRQIRDQRIPAAGIVLLRDYKGQKIAVTVLEDGFEWEGRSYRSLSAIAKEVTGAHWNGLRFFGLHRKEIGK